MNGLGRLALCLFLVLTSCSGPAQAGGTRIGHPDKPGAQVEYFVREPAGDGPWPTIIFLHGHQAPPSRPGGEVFVRWGVLDRYAERGYLAVSVSLPGYGGSSGPEDFAGPFTQHAVEAVLSRLEVQGQAAPDKVLIQGVSLGAITAALVAARQRRVAGLVLISGLYDLPAYFAQPKTPGALQVQSALIRQTGATDRALRARSVLPVAERIKASTLILNGAKDDRTDPDQARLLAEVIKAHGGEAQVRIYPEFGHEIPVKAREAEVDAFIAVTLGRSEPGSRENSPSRPEVGSVRR